MADLLITRQAIFERDLTVAGYVLRSSAPGDPDDQTGERGVTPNQLVGPLVDLGIDRLATRHPLYIACELEGMAPLLEFCAISPRLGLCCHYREREHSGVLDIARLCAARGVRLALMMDDLGPDANEVLSHAEIALLYAPRVGAGRIGEWVKKLSGYRANAGLYGIDSYAKFETAREAGCRNFQGDFLEESDRWQAKKIPSGAISPIALLAYLQNPRITIGQIEELVRADAALSYRVLRWVNSAYYGIEMEIDNIGHAIVYLGLDQLRNMLSLMALSKLRPASTELLMMSAIRARMAELLAPKYDLDPSKAFTLGIFSLVDAIAQVSIDKVLESIPLNHDIAKALKTGTGLYGPLLHLIVNYEKGNWNMLGTTAKADHLTDAFRQAVEWANHHRMDDTEALVTTPRAQTAGN